MTIGSPAETAGVAARGHPPHRFLGRWSRARGVGRGCVRRCAFR